jgi:hypothetical protein
MLDVDFEMPNVALLSYRWKYSWKVIGSVASRYPDRFFTLRYEDLVSDAPAKFRELCDFLAIPYDDSIFSFHTRKEEVRKSFSPEVIDRYFKSLFNPIDSSRVGIYKERLSAFRIKIADTVVGRSAEEAGYRRNYQNFNILAYLWSLPAVLYARWLYSVGWLVGLLPYRTMMWLLNKPSVVVRIYTRLVNKEKAAIKTTETLRTLRNTEN